MKVYIKRMIDLEDVAYGDTFYKTKKEAIESVEGIKKSKYSVYIIIKVVTGYHDFDEFVDRFETENIYQAFDDNAILETEIIYKK